MPVKYLSEKEINGLKNYLASSDKLSWFPDIVPLLSKVPSWKFTVHKTQAGKFYDVTKTLSSGITYTLFNAKIDIVLSFLDAYNLEIDITDILNEAYNSEGIDLL